MVDLLLTFRQEIDPTRQVKPRRASSEFRIDLAGSVDNVAASSFDAARKRVLREETPDKASRHQEATFDPVGTCDVYDLKLDGRLSDLAVRLVIAWDDEQDGTP